MSRLDPEGVNHRTVRSERRYFPAWDGVTVTNHGPGTVYYGSASVTTSSYTGTISANASVNLTTGYYFVSASESKLSLDYETTLEYLQGQISEIEGTDLTAIEEDIAILNEFINVKNYGCEGDGVTDDTTAFQAALTAAEGATAAGAKVVIPPGSYLLDGEINCDQFVSIQGAGSRETILKLNDATSVIHFNEYGGGTNSRGGEVRGFHIDGQNLATTCMYVDLAVNRNFSDFRVSRPGEDGVALLVETAQNCNFRDFDVEATRATLNTTGIKVTDSTGGCRFHDFSINEFSYAAIHVTQDNAGANKGVNLSEPRHISFTDGMVERGVPATVVLVRVHSGRDVWFERLALACGVGETVADPYNIVEVNNSGAGSSRQIYFKYGVTAGNTAAAKKSTAFMLEDTGVYTKITDWQFGNNLEGVNITSGHNALVKDYNNTSTTTMFPGAAPNAQSKTAANTISTIDPLYDYYPISGNTTINTLNATHAGHEIVLHFSGTPTVSSSAGNLKLSGLVDMSATADDLLCLVCDGADWHETSRVVK